MIKEIEKKLSLEELKTIELAELIEEKKDKNNNLETLNILSLDENGTFIKKEIDIENKNGSKSDFSKYKIISKNSFVYKPKGIQIGLLGRYDSDEKGIIDSKHVVFKIKNSDLITTDYLLHFLKSKNFNKKTSKILSDENESNLKFKYFSKIKINLPSIETQKKITKHLNNLLNLEKNISLFDSILENLINVNTNKIFNDLIKKRDLFKPIGELIKIFSKPNTNRDILPSYKVGKNKLSLKPSNEDFIKNAKNDLKIISYNDFVFSPFAIQDGTIQQLKHKNDGLVSSKYITFKLKTNIYVNASYLLRLLKTKYFRTVFKRLLKGDIPAISTDEFEEVEVPVPSKNEQDNIANLFNQILELKDINQELVKTSKIIRNYLYEFFIK